MTRFSTMTAMAIAMTATQPAWAQDQDNDADEQAGNLIVVTAQKTEQTVQDVAVTVTATTGQTLEERGISELDELSLYVPGLFIQEQSANNPGFVIRGITSDSGSAQQSARVTVYYNGVDISRSRGSYQDIYDIDRIEVIKGPQATLFGTAATIGAVSIISARPKEGFSGDLRLGYGNFDQVLVDGHLNYGTDVIAGRIAGAYKRRDGFVRNIAGDPNVPNQNSAGIDQDDLYAQDQLGLRASLRFTPSDDFTFDLIGTYDQQRNSGTPFVSGTLPATGGNTSPFGVVELSGSPFSAAVLGMAELGLNRGVYDVNATIDWDLGDGFALTMINGYREFDSLEVFDADGSPAPFLEFAEDAQGWQFSHETRIAYASDNFRSFAGFNYFIEDSSQAVPFATEEGIYLQCAARLVPGLPCVAPNGTVTSAQATAILTRGLATALPYSSVFTNFGRNDALSFFADGTFLPSPNLELTFGFRFLIETRESGFSSVQPNSVISRAPLLPVVNTNGLVLRAEDDFDAFLPRLNILYRITPSLNAYATVSRGRRSAVVDVNARTAVSPRVNLIDAEVVSNYEGGLKYAANGISGSVAVFYQDYDNFQVTLPTTPPQTISAGTATSFGVEAEFSAQINENISVFANGAYIDASIDDDPGNGTLAGARFRLQSEWQLAGGFTINYPINESVAFFLTPSVTYQSELFFEQPNNPLIREDGYALVNVRGGVSFEDGRYEIVGFARNLFDEEYLIDAGNTGGAFGIPTFIPGEPLFYGVQVAAKF